MEKPFTVQYTFGHNWLTLHDPSPSYAHAVERARKVLGVADVCEVRVRRYHAIVWSDSRHDALALEET